MVRMVAMTASFEMSSQVGADIGGKRKFEPEQDPGGESEPDLASFQPRRLAVRDRLQQGGHGLQRAEGDDEHRAALDGKRNVARDQIEFVCERRVQAPTPIWRRPPASL